MYWTHWEGKSYQSEKFDTLIEAVHRMANNEDRGGPNCMASEDGTFYWPKNRTGVGIYIRSSNENILERKYFSGEPVILTSLGRKFETCWHLVPHTKHGPGKVQECFLEDGNIIIVVEGGQMIDGWIESYKIRKRGPIVLNRDSYCPQCTTTLDVTVMCAAQQDGRSLTEEEMKELFYKSARAMLEDLREGSQQMLEGGS